MALTPKHLKRALEDEEFARNWTNRLVKELNESGHSWSELAEATGLTVSALRWRAGQARSTTPAAERQGKAASDEPGLVVEQQGAKPKRTRAKKPTLAPVEQADEADSEPTLAPAVQTNDPSPLAQWYETWEAPPDRRVFKYQRYGGPGHLRSLIPMLDDGAEVDDSERATVSIDRDKAKALLKTLPPLNLELEFEFMSLKDHLHKVLRTKEPITGYVVAPRQQDERIEIAPRVERQSLANPRSDDPDFNSIWS